MFRIVYILCALILFSREAIQIYLLLHVQFLPCMPI